MHILPHPEASTPGAFTLTARPLLEQGHPLLRSHRKPVVTETVHSAMEGKAHKGRSPASVPHANTLLKERTTDTPMDGVTGKPPF